MLGISASRREGGLGPPSRVATAAGNLVASRSEGGRSPPQLASAEQWGTFRPKAEASNQAGMPVEGITASRREGGLGPPSRVATAAGNLVASRSVGGRSPPHLASAEQWGTFRPKAEASNQAGMPLGGGPPSTSAVAGEQGERREKREKEIEWDQDPFWPAERAREGDRERDIYK